MMEHKHGCREEEGGGNRDMEKNRHDGTDMENTVIMEQRFVKYRHDGTQICQIRT